LFLPQDFFFFLLFQEMETEFIHYTNVSRKRIHAESYEQQGLYQPQRDYRTTSMREMTEDMISEELRQVHLLLAEAQLRIRSLQTDYSTRLLQLEAIELRLEAKERRMEEREGELNEALQRFRQDTGLDEHWSSH
jgi:hypothetical protein